MVLRYDIEEFKDSARRALKQADAAIVVNSNLAKPLWKGLETEAFLNIRVFATADPRIIPQGFLDYVQSRLPH